MNYNPGDKIICINAVGEEDTLERGKEYTCHDIWKCDKDVLCTVEELPITTAPLKTLLAIITRTPCSACGKPMVPFYAYAAARFIKKPDESDIIRETIQNDIDLIKEKEKIA